ncbi:MAG: hypothetical protein ABL901_10635 [Hyphomicrobiaceae bacterium]
MATILDFQAATMKRASGLSANEALAEGAGGPAELIFFPGVRYERMDTPAPRKRSAKSRGRAHDQIDLPD